MSEGVSPDSQACRSHMDTSDILRLLASERCLVYLLCLQGSMLGPGVVAAGSLTESHGAGAMSVYSLHEFLRDLRFLNQSPFLFVSQKAGCFKVFSNKT